MKVLVLILASDGYPYNRYEEQWRRYMNLDPRFECYFYKGVASLTTPYDCSNNTLRIRQGENRHLILEKTYKALEFFRPRFAEFDYIARPNMSSLFLWERYAAYLEGLPREGLLEGHFMPAYGGYPSGCGFTMSTDVAEKILDLRYPQRIMDDVTFGDAAKKLDISIKPRTFTEVRQSTLTTQLPQIQANPSIFHLRICTDNRVEDVGVYRSLITDLYSLPPDRIAPDMTLTLQGESVGFYAAPFKGVVSIYFTDADQRYFCKQVTYNSRYSILPRELFFLDMLKDKPWAPKLAYTNNKDIVVTDYIGERLTAANCPADAAEQAIQILEELHALSITHNDIKDGEILVRDGRLFLIDYGWSRLNGSMSCGRGFFDQAKPGGDVHDSNFLTFVGRALKRTIPIPDSLKHLRRGAPPIAVAAAVAPAHAALNTPYKDSRRPHGSQSEVPRIVEKDGILHVSGYQHFTVNRATKRAEPQSKREKYLKLQALFADLVAQGCMSIADLGCSAGILSFLAHQAGFQRVHAMDHDVEYLEIVRSCTMAMDASGAILPSRYSFGDLLPTPCDVVLMISLLHWVFSCTALYGNFQDIATYLKGIGARFLCIEWIDPRDQAIQFLKHTEMNKAVQKEAYTLENFLKAFGTPVKVIPMENSTRTLYVFATK